MPRFFIEVSTAWCGEDQQYTAIANTEDDLYDIVDDAAYSNFMEFNGLQQIMDDEGLTEDEAIEVEHEYYFSNITEWDETRPEEEWGWYELLCDLTKE